MCGLIGIASTRCIGDRAWLAAGRDTMLHRGPDDAGEWWSQDGRVGLAHRRLSILDLSPLGHQPMHDDARGLSISYNGETKLKVKYINKAPNGFGPTSSRIQGDPPGNDAPPPSDDDIPF